MSGRIATPIAWGPLEMVPDGIAFNDVKPEDIQTEVFRLPSNCFAEEEGSLTKGDREMIVTATSAANQCLYCVVAHGAILRIRAKNPLLADQIATNYRKADISPRQKAMLDFAMKVSTAAQTVADADMAALAQAGMVTIHPEEVEQ